MHTLTRDDIEQAARHLYEVMPATAQYAWPLLAERLGCTKTNVSLQIKALESRLGVALFRRTTRLVSLTQAGEQLYQHCLPLLQQLMEAQSSEQNLSGTLVIRSKIRLKKA